MDPTRSFRERQAVKRSAVPIFSPHKIALGCLGGIGIFFGIVCSIVGDARMVYEAWPFRNAVRTDAQIFDYQFERLENAPNMGFERLGGDHRFSYRFEADGQEVTGEHASFSSDPTSVVVMDRFFAVGPDATIPVYYAPDDPNAHVLFINPKPFYKDSATRLGWISLIIAIGLLIVVLVVVFYRPKKTERLFMPEKIDIPKDIELKPPERI